MFRKIAAGSFVVAATLLTIDGLTTPSVAGECRARVHASSAVGIADAGSAGRAQSLACSQARSKWSQLVRRRYGARFTGWNAARERLQSLKIEGEKIKCGVQAIPCAPTVRAPRR